MIFTYDIEAVSWTKYVIGCVYDGDTAHYADDPGELLNLIRSLAKTAIDDEVPLFYAHYGGKYDIRFLLRPLVDSGLRVRYQCVSRSLARVSVYEGKRKIFELRDSFALLPAALKDLAKDFGAPLKLDVDRAHIERLSRPELLEYVSRDCIALYHVLREYAKLSDGIVKLTSASTAWASWSQDFDEKLLRASARDDVFLRASYFGGDVQTYVRYGKKLKSYDVDSMYPWVMDEYEYPGGRSYRTTTYHPTRLGIYECFVTAPHDLAYPYLPMRQKDGLLYGVGTWRGTYTSVDIAYARSLGYGIEIVRGIVFAERLRPFQSYIRRWHGTKLAAEREGKKGKRFVAKRRMNDLYGKFGQRRMFDEIFSGDVSRDDMERRVRVLDNDLRLFIRDKAERRPWTYVHVASFVTSYARRRLHQAKMEIHAQGKHVYACDTDGLDTDGELKTGVGLGEWGQKGEIIDEGIYLAPKLYAQRRGRKITKKAKGLRADRLRWKDYQAALRGDWSGMKSSRVRIVGLFAASRRGLTVLDTIRERRAAKGTFWKRTLAEDGIFSLPIYISAADNVDYGCTTKTPAPPDISRARKSQSRYESGRSRSPAPPEVRTLTTRRTRLAQTSRSRASSHGTRISDGDARVRRRARHPRQRKRPRSCS